MKYIGIVFLFTWMLTSCIPDENPVKPFDRGDIQLSSVTMGHSYSDQLYYSFEAKGVIKQNNVLEWDVAFSCQEEEFEVILNYGKFMRVHRVEDRNFEDIDKAYSDAIADENWVYDSPGGFKDSTALGKWWSETDGEISSNQHIYLIDRGIDDRSRKIGTVKFQILKYENSTYTIRYCDVRNSNIYEHNITKIPEYNFVQLSFTGAGNVLNLEPPREQWDLVFSKYTELLYTNEGDGMWYGVTGAYLNPNQVEGGIVRGDFKSIELSVLDTVNLTNQRNIIGHDWKYFNLEAGSYMVDVNKIFLVKGVTGFYYKMHFVDFYDDSGNRGTPKFEFQKL